MYKLSKVLKDKDIRHETQDTRLKTGPWSDVCGLLLIVCIFILFFSGPVSAKDKSGFNIDFQLGWDGYFRPMEWTPVEITVHSVLEKAFDGELTLTSQQDGLNTLNIIQDCTLTPGLPEYKPLVTKVAFTIQPYRLNLAQKIGERRKTVWSDGKDIKLAPGKSQVINEQDMLIGVVGMSKFGLLGLDKEKEIEVVSQYQGNVGNVRIGSKQEKLAPYDWTGFVSLDLLFLYDPDWSQFKEEQLKAIAKWVSNGGKLLLVLGSRPPMGDNPLTKILPFDFLNPKQVTISSGLLNKWSLTGSQEDGITVRPLVVKPGVKFYEGDSYQDDQYLFGVGNVGFGKVGMLSFDPGDLSDSQKANMSRFWVKIIQTMLNVEEIKRGVPVGNSVIAQRRIENIKDPGGNQNDMMRTVRGQSIPQQYNQGYYNIAGAYSLNNKVMEFLYAEIKPLSVWFVIFLLGALAILLGPVDYKFLKHIDRLPLTWLTCSFWIILFTVGAYYGVQYIRGGKMQLKVVSVLDGIKDSDAVWATRYSGLFASRSDSYQLEGLMPNQWWSGIAPTQDQISMYNSELGSRRIYCNQKDGGNLPESLPVNIWDIQCMLTEEPIEKLPFSADVQQIGSEITVTVKNESDAAITSGYVLLDGGKGIEFGTVPAHGNEEFKRQSRSLTYWTSITRDYSQQRYSSSSVTNFRNEAAFFAQGSIQRTQSIINYLSKGAAVVCVAYDKAPISFKVKDHAFDYEHVQLARLVVFPN
jgi:hypothetical protein